MTVSLRNTQEFNDYILERLYGTLKIYELDMEQDEEIGKGQKKENSYVALVASSVENVKEKSIALVANSSKVSKEESSESRKGKGKVIEEHDSDEDMDEIDEHLAFLSKRFSKMKFKKHPNAAKPFKSNLKSEA